MKFQGIIMSKINLESITDQVRGLLQREIEAGKLEPGTRIHEGAFASRLGISKSPLRFALYQLKQDGIIRIEPRKGFYVALPTRKEFFELLEMREVLEGLAARRAAGCADRKVVRRLSDCFSGFDENNLHDRRMEYATADHRFHRRLAEASGSAELIKTLEVVNIRLHMNRLRAMLSRQHDLRPLHREHLAIIDAISTGDCDRAEMLASAHVGGVPWETVINDSGTVVRDSAELPNPIP
jgi:DNA-binding GntR family transcriptional regulator